MNNHRVIALDGPAGSGKSSTAKLLAKKLGFTYLDTGAMYRCVTWAALEQGVDLNDENRISEIASSIKIEIIPGENEDRIMMNGLEVTWNIRGPKVDAGVSLVSSYKKVREVMVKLQREFAHQRDIVAEGRDMGTVVFPKADLKLYLVADLETRAIRRCRQLDAAGIGTTIEEQTSSLSSRDLFDSGRENSPLMKAEGAVEIDTTNMSLSGQVEKVYDMVCRELGIE